MCSLRSLTCLQVEILPRQWMVGPSSHSRPWLGETPAGASSAVNDSQRREGEANGPKGQRPARASRAGANWAEFARLAHQAVVALVGAGTPNRAKPTACGCSRGSRRLDTEPETERTAGPASNAAGDGCGRAQDYQAGFQPYWGKPAVRNEQMRWRKRPQDPRAICHNARKGRNTGSHWSKPARLRSTLPIINRRCGKKQIRIKRSWLKQMTEYELLDKNDNS